MNKNVFSFFVVSAFFGAISPSLAGTPDNGISFSDPLDRITLQNGMEMRFDVGIGSGACRLASDPKGIIYTVTDRGPNIKTKDAQKLMGIDFSTKKGKIFPTHNFSPTIYKLDRPAGKVVGEYVYQIDTPDTFGMDNSKKKRKQNNVKVSEVTAVDTDKLVVLERISSTTRFFLVDLATADNIA